MTLLERGVSSWDLVYELLNLSHPSDGAEVVK